MINSLNFAYTSYYDASLSSDTSVFWFGAFLALIAISVPLFVAFRKGIIQTNVFKYWQGLYEQLLETLDRDKQRKRLINNFLGEARAVRDTIYEFQAANARPEQIIHAIKSTDGYEIEKSIAEILELGKSIFIGAENIKFIMFSAIQKVNSAYTTREVYDYLNSPGAKAKVEVDYNPTTGTSNRYTNAQSAEYYPAGSASNEEPFGQFVEPAVLDKAGIKAMVFSPEKRFRIQFRDKSERDVTGKELNELQAPKTQANPNGRDLRLMVDFIIVKRYD